MAHRARAHAAAGGCRPEAVNPAGPSPRCKGHLIERQDARSRALETNWRRCRSRSRGTPSSLPWCPLEGRHRLNGLGGREIGCFQEVARLWPRWPRNTGRVSNYSPEHAFCRLSRSFRMRPGAQIRWSPVHPIAGTGLDESSSSLPSLLSAGRRRRPRCSRPASKGGPMGLVPMQDQAAGTQKGEHSQRGHLHRYPAEPAFKIRRAPARRDSIEQALGTKLRATLPAIGLPGVGSPS